MNYLQIIIKNKRIILILLLISIISLLLHVLSQERFVPYNIQETIIHKNIEGKNKYFIYGTFTIKSQCFLNPTTKGMYIVPVNSKGKVLEETKNILFYAPFNGEDGATAYERYAWLKVFAEQHNFAIFSLRIKADTYSTNEKSKYYIYKEAGWFSGIFKIQYFLQKRFNLTKNKLCAIGQSSGCSMIQRMAVEMPDKFAVAAGHGGCRFSPYIPNQKFPPFILSSTVGDSTNMQNRENYVAATKANIKLWYMETHPINNKDLHSASNDVFRVLTAFILSAVDTNSEEKDIFIRKFENMPLFQYPLKKNKKLAPQIDQSL